MRDARGGAATAKALRSVRLFYGTNRARTDACGGVAVARWGGSGRCRPTAYYGGLPALPAEDGADDGEGLEVGTLAVTFPPDHAVGKIERPLQVFSVTLRAEDPDRDVVISELRSFADPMAWARELRATGRDQAFVYVHGFETTFDEAALRAAQLAYDLDFDLDPDFRGVPMLFSWPSRGGVDAYMADYEASFESIGAFNRFLNLVKGEAGLLAASRGIERFDAIDASTLSTDFLGHGYYASHGSMLGDIYCLLKGTPAQGRPLLALAGTAWRFRPPQELAALDPAACATAVAATPRAPLPAPPPAAFRGGAAVALAAVAAALVGLAVRRLRRRP